MPPKRTRSLSSEQAEQPETKRHKKEEKEKPANDADNDVVMDQPVDDELGDLDMWLPDVSAVLNVLTLRIACSQSFSTYVVLTCTLAVKFPSKVCLTFCTQIADSGRKWPLMKGCSGWLYPSPAFFLWVVLTWQWRPICLKVPPTNLLCVYSLSS